MIIQGNVGGSTQHFASVNLPYCGRVIVGAHAIAVVRAIRIAGQSNVAITVGHMASVLIDDCMIDHNVGPVCSTDCTLPSLPATRGPTPWHARRRLSPRCVRGMQGNGGGLYGDTNSNIIANELSS